MIFLAEYVMATIYSYVLCLSFLYMRVKEGKKFDAVEIVCMVILPPIAWYKIGKHFFNRFLRLAETPATVASIIAANYYFITIPGTISISMRTDYENSIIPGIEAIILWIIVPLTTVVIQLTIPASGTAPEAPAKPLPPSSVYHV